MAESIRIKKFGPIEEVEIDDIRPLTIFIGESGSGKSAILKTLALFRWLYKMVNIRSYLKHAGISKSPFRFNFESYISNNGFEDYLYEDTEIEYRDGKNTIRYANGKLTANNTIPLSELSLEKICFISDKRNIIPDILANKIEKKNSSFYLKETLDDFLTATRAVNELDLGYLGVKFVIKKTSNGIKYYIKNLSQERDQEFEIKFEDSSSGTQTVTPLTLIVKYLTTKYDIVQAFNNAVFGYLKNSDNLKLFHSSINVGEIRKRRIHIHIEEPELSLYPESQRHMIDFLVKNCISNHDLDYGITLMMATHSPYIINHLNLLIMAHKRDKSSDRAKLSFDDVDVYEITGGYLTRLNIERDSIINTRPLSEPINAIYNEYNALKQQD